MIIGLLLDDTLDRPDGVQQAVIAIGENMRSKGHEVHYVVAQTKRLDLENVHSIGDYYSIKFNGNSVRTPKPALKKNIKRLFSSVDFDVLHVQMPYSPFFTASVLKNAPGSVKKFGTFHILPYSRITSVGTRLLGLSLRRSLNSLDGVFAVSEPARIFMKRTFKVDGAVIPNPVDYQFFHSFKKQKKTKKQIVFVGRFEQRKGVKELVAAYARIDQAVRDTTELVMCGKGPLLNEVEQISKKQGLGIVFPGFVSDDEKAQYLANADIAVFPSLGGESFGIVLTEAMSAGAGITIGGNNPGYASVLEQWPETLFDPANTVEFANVLSTLLDKPGKVGAEQHEAVKQYDVKVVVESLLAQYGEA